MMMDVEEQGGERLGRQILSILSCTPYTLYIHTQYRHPYEGSSAANLSCQKALKCIFCPSSVMSLTSSAVNWKVRARR